MMHFIVKAEATPVFRHVDEPSQLTDAIFQQDKQSFLETVDFDLLTEEGQLKLVSVVRESKNCDFVDPNGIRAYAATKGTTYFMVMIRTPEKIVSLCSDPFHDVDLDEEYD